MVYLLKDKYDESKNIVVCTDMCMDTLNGFIKQVIKRNYTEDYIECNVNASELGCFAETFDNGKDNGFVVYNGVMYGMSVYEPNVIEFD